jgi:hypothetical protein
MEVRVVPALGFEPGTIGLNLGLRNVRDVPPALFKPPPVFDRSSQQ